MMVSLGHTHAPYRAYLVSGLLNAHDVKAHVQHDRAAQFYGGGGCITTTVWIANEAWEVLMARPDEADFEAMVGPDHAEGMTLPPVTCVLIGVATLWLGVNLLLFLGTQSIQWLPGGRHDFGRSLAALPFATFTLVLDSLMFGSLVALLCLAMFPFIRMYQQDRWPGKWVMVTTFLLVALVRVCVSPSSRWSQKSFSTPPKNTASLYGMFVWLGDTYDTHRAHIVRGMLEAHGVRAVVWHEMPLIHKLVPGWLGCRVMVPEGDAEAAMEIMNARPEEAIPEDATGEIAVPFQKYPGFRDWMATGALVVATFLIVELLARTLGKMAFRGHSFGYLDSEPALSIGDLLGVVLLLPFGTLAFAICVSVFMAPLVIWDGHRWVGLISYLFVQWFLFFAFPLLAGVLASALPIGPVRRERSTSIHLPQFLFFPAIDLPA